MRVLIFLTIILLVQFLHADGNKSVSMQLTQLVNAAFNEAKNKNHYISLAARNKMLSQQIAKDAVKIVTKIDEKKARKDIDKHIKEFKRTIDAFLYGNKKLGVTPLKEPLAVQELNEIKEVWGPFEAAAIKVKNSKKPAVKAFVTIYKTNERLLALSHKLTQTLKGQRKVKTTFSPIIEHSLKFLDRERFLTQKLIKEKFLLYRKIDVNRNKVRLHGSFILFEHTLQGLLNGDKKRGLIAITNKKIRAKLKLLEKEWNKDKDIYKFKRKKLTKKDLQKINANNDLMLQTTEDLVHMVEKALDI